MTMRPASIQIARSQMARIADAEWLTRKIASASSRSSSIRAALFSTNSLSPVERASSINKMSCVIAVAIANFNRAPIPDEYVLIGICMDLPIPLNSTMSSNFEAISFGDIPSASNPSSILRAPVNDCTSADPIPSNVGLPSA